MSLDKYESLNQIIKKASNVCFFGGAGVSTGSGLLDFRSKDGLYNIKSKYGCSYEEMLSIDYFLKRPITFYKFYKEFMIKDGVKPNKAHYTLAKFDEVYNNLSIVTQNIDGLHQLAGSSKVTEIHGTIYNNFCPKCYKQYGIKKIIDSDPLPRCSCGGIIRPDVILYGEQLDSISWYEAADAFSKAEVLIIGGTSLNVYPAADLIQYYKGNCLIIINKDVTPYDHLANFVFHEDIGEVLEKIMKIQ